MVERAAVASGSGQRSDSSSRPESNGFHTSLDYIPFDFGEDGNEDDVEDRTNNTSVDESFGWDDDSRGRRGVREDDKRSERRKGRGTSTPTDSRPSSPGPKGKKRKRGEDVDRRAKRRELARGTPWCVDVDFDQCRTVTDILHEELAAFEQWISPSRKEHETRSMVIQLIRRAITSQWKDASVHSFGSQNTELYMPQGDIDLVVVSASMENQRREGALRNMAACLRRNNLATDVQVIAKAKVPIIKFVCTYGNFRVDISVNQTNGLEAADFVISWLKKMPSLRPIIMATKLLLSQRGMSEVFSGGLGSFSVICMAISHFQLHPKIQRQEIDPSRNLGVLFLEFLELYGKNFGYDRTGISIRGRGGYFDKQARGWLEPAKPFMFAIEDPNDPSNNICRGSFQILQVRSALGGAFDILTTALCERANEMAAPSGRQSQHHKRFLNEDDEARAALLNGASSRNIDGEKDPQSLLGTILGVNREVFKARKEVADLWDSGSLQSKLRRAPPKASPEPMPRRPLPSPPRETLAEIRRKERRAPREAATAERSSVAQSNGFATTTNGGVSSGRQATHSKEELNGARGTAKNPIVVMDTSSSKGESGHGQSKKHASASSSARNALAIEDDVDVLDEDELAASYGITFASQRTDSFGDEEEEARDSRYTSSENRHGKKRRKALEEYAREASDAYVTDSSLSDEEAGEKRRKLHDETDRARSLKSRSRDDFWASKGNSVGGRDISDDDAV